MRTRALLLALYTLVLIGFFLYSFTQIDLSLALTRIPQVQSVIVGFQHIGYFLRPLSTLYYLILLLLLTAFYILFLWLGHKKKFSSKFIWKVILIATVIFTFSYNAFSYDIFNYIFDARIFTHYHANPYLHKPLDYVGDPMLSFMRWTHRTFPYGPLWLGITIPFSFVGLQFFLPTYLLFKIFISLSFIGSLYFVKKILQKTNPDSETFGLIFLGLNPLMLIEGVMNSHLDMVMMFFSLWAFYLLIQKKYVVSYFILFVSIGIKFVTGFILPAFILLQLWHQRKAKTNWDVVAILFIVTISAGVISETIFKVTFQPWYLISYLAFAVLLANKYYVLLPSIIISFFALLTYVPFLYTGNWDPPIPTMLSDMYFLSYALSFFAVSLVFGYKQVLYAKQHKKTIMKKK